MTTITNECETIINQYRKERRDNGVASTDRKWATPLLSSWINSMHQGQLASIEEQTLCAALMRENLAMRDAIILSIVTDTNMSTLLDWVADNHSKKTKNGMYKALTEAFNHGSEHYERKQTAIRLLDQLADNIPELAAQPNAIAAYTALIIGDAESADMHARRALTQDADCSLACMVCAMLQLHL